MTLVSATLTLCSYVFEYAYPGIDTAEPEGREMCAMNGVSHEVDVDSE